MNEFCVDSKSSQYKAPFNKIANEVRVSTYKNAAVLTPNRHTVNGDFHFPESFCMIAPP
jgi:hypothetical protein